MASNFGLNAGSEIAPLTMQDSIAYYFTGLEHSPLHQAKTFLANAQLTRDLGGKTS